MRLLSIGIENFRQFSGKHGMNLEVQPNKNVIVIHGENGAGKTTLLNAFKWCFYGETDFDSKSDNLFNEKALAKAGQGDKLTMSVTVEFENDGMRHTAKRECLFKKTAELGYEANGGEVFSLTWIDNHGGYHNSPSAETHMSQILPEKMQPYFFFNGERIEKLAHVNSAEQIQSAIKNLMGLEIVERANNHLSGPVISRLRKELKESSPKDLADVIENENNVAEHIKDTQQKIVQLDRNVSEFQEELQQVNKAFDSHSEVAGLNKERLSLEEQIKTVGDAVDAIKKDRAHLVSSMGGLAFAENLMNISRDILEEKRQKGELPFKVKEQFITDLLADGCCICERELKAGTAPYHAVHAFKSSTTSVDVETAFIETSGAVGQMTRSRDDLFTRLAAFQTQESGLNTDILQKQGRVEAIGKKIGGREVEDITALESKRGKLLEQIIQANQQKGALGQMLSKWEEQHAELKKERDKLSVLHAKGEAATRRLKLAEEVERVLESLYTALAEQVRERLSEKVNTTFKSIMRKQYWAEISSDYTLQIYKKIDNHDQIVYEKSTGENQVTSLSFVGSIVSLAKERSKSDNENFRGGVFPIVMDSPFGALDPDYRRKIAEYIPELAEQVIIMASDSQWMGEVEQQVTPRMARQYSLRYHTPSASGDDTENEVDTNEKYEYTQIEEGYHVR